MERHSPTTTPFVLAAAAEMTVYNAQPLALPADVPVTFFNTGASLVRLRIQGNADYVPVGVGTYLTFNPSGDVYATVDTGTGNLLVCTGMRSGSSGVSSTGALTQTELSALTTFGQKELLAMMLRQLQLLCEHASRVTGEQLFERDLSPHVLGVHDV